MRGANIYSIRRCMPRMSWHPQNLFNLWRRSVGDRAQELDFKMSRTKLFDSRWKSKALVRAYHGDIINESTFKRWYLPSTLPDVRPARRAAGDDSRELQAIAGRGRNVVRELKRKEDEERHANSPVGSLMFAEVERRIDTFLFRCCFAHSIYEARRMIIHGNVKLNGVKHQRANTRLAPGDMITVDPSAIRFLQESSSPSSEDPSTPTIESDATASEPEPENEDAESYPVLSTRIEETTPAPKTHFKLPDYAAPWIFIPAYAEVSFPTCSAVYVRHPTARADYSEIPTPYDADGEVVRLAWEWYARVRPRTRSKRQLARMPENRQERTA